MRPLAHVRVVELAGQVPTDFAGMLLADLGADVVRVARPGGSPDEVVAADVSLLQRGKRRVELDLKSTDGISTLLELISHADIVIEGFRPGVAERLGVGPEACHGLNPKLVYGRITGWGQSGPFAQGPGHDITYVAATGALNAIGSAGGPPVIPLTLLGNFAGGALYLVTGVLAALHAAEETGCGDIVDLAEIDGVTHLLSAIYNLVNSGDWQDRRGVNLVDGGAPFYAVYATSDAQYMAVGAMEPRFFAELLSGLEIAEPAGNQADPATWPALRDQIATAFARRNQAAWTTVFADGLGCVSPVLSMHEAAQHPQIRHRGSIRTNDGRLSAGLAPRFASGADEHPATQSRVALANAVLAEWTASAPSR